MKEFSSQIEYPKTPNTPVSPDFYYKVMAGISEKIGEDSPVQKMASIFCDTLQIPVGPTSSLTTRNIRHQNGEIVGGLRTEEDVSRDRIIGTVFANIPGVYVGMGENRLKEHAPIITLDINKILDALEEKKQLGNIGISFQQFIEALPEKERSIILSERKLRKEKKGLFPGINVILGKINHSLVYFGLPGGVGIFLRGYEHHKRWQKLYGTELIKIYAPNSSIALIEGLHDNDIGKSLEYRWKGFFVDGAYDTLMRGIIDKNPKILFGEIDGRNDQNVKMDTSDYLNFTNLPPKFYENYYEYILKINPEFIKKDPRDLKNILKLQSTSYQGTEQRDITKRDKYTDMKFHSFPSVTSEGKISSHMTGFELGQMMYADALSAVKLHMLAKLSTDGHLPPGPIVDFQGAFHLSGKTFFMQYPQYALMVVLMNIHELMAGTARKLETNDKTAVAYSEKIFKNPNWKDVIKEILKLPIMAVEQDPKKTVEPGLNQKTLINVSPDFAKIYNININEIAGKLEVLFNLHKNSA